MPVTYLDPIHLLNGGVEHIDLVICMPPIMNQCSWGIDFADPKKLIYNQLMIDDTGDSFEERLRKWLCEKNEKFMSKLRIFFQDFNEFKDFAGHKNCLYCFGDKPPYGLMVGVRDDERTHIA